MQGSGKNWICFFCVLVFSLLKTQAQDIWSDVTMNRSNTYMGQPVEVSITVYTSTWFTTGLDLGNIKVEGAFTVYFRPVTTSFQKDGKTYAGVKQIYHVFPYSDKDITFPQLTIEVESPAPGDYKGKKHSVKTIAKNIQVKPIPSKFSEDDWLVADGLSVTESWSGSRDNVKVGDVLVRTISRNAAGTVSELIPPIRWDSIAHVSFYPTRSEVNNAKTKTSISASRTEHMRYLFLEEGEVTLPELVFTWYNPYRNQLFKRTLKEVTIEVQPNPDLGVLASVKDSLENEQVELLAEKEEQLPITILGMSVKKFSALLLFSILFLILLIKIGQKFWRSYQNKHQEYLHSEQYYWDLFIKNYSQSDKKTSLKNLYRWLDEIGLMEPTMDKFIGKYGTERLVRTYSQSQDFEAKVRLIFENELLSEWKNSRKAYLKQDENQIPQTASWINPQQGLY